MSHLKWVLRTELQLSTRAESLLNHKVISLLPLPFLSLFVRARTHTCTSICVFVSLSLCVSICISVSLSLFLCVCVSICISVFLSACVSISVSVSLSLSFSFCLSLLHPSNFSSVTLSHRLFLSVPFLAISPSPFLHPPITLPFSHRSLLTSICIVKCIWTVRPFQS